MFAEIDTIAEMIGSPQATPTVRMVITALFATSGRVQYRAVAIPHSARKREGSE